MAQLPDNEICWIATTRPDGRPHLTPIWFVWRNERAWLCCSSTSVKANNLRANPNVSFSLQDGAHPVVGEGTALLHERPFPADVATAFRQAFDWDINAACEEPYDCLIEIEITRWLMDGSAV